MNRWVARLLALVIAAAAVYLVYANVHAGNILLESTLAAAVLAIATVLLAWKRPVAALILNVVWVAGAVVVSTSVAHQLPSFSPVPQAMAQSTESTAPASTVDSASQVSSGNPTADVAAEAKRVGGTVPALLTRVSDGVRYELYSGAFRGSAATLADGRGNDADKALLLHDLILASNPSATLRYATCTLDAAQADKLIADAVARYRPPHVLAEFAGAVAADPKTSQKAKAYLTRVAGAWTDLTAQAKDASPRLASQLQTAGIPVKTVTAQDLRPVVTAHVWLQQQSPSGWTDLDPSLSHATPGSSLCTASATMADLAPQQYVTVTARVHVESRTNGDRTLMQQTWNAVALSGKTLAFMFAEPTDTKVTAPTAVPSGMVAYTPVLRVGDAIAEGQPIVLPEPAGAGGTSYAAAAAQGARSAVSAFGTPTPTPAATATPIPIDISAAWLQVTVTAPGLKPTTIDTPIFDSVPYADRAAGKAATAELAPIESSGGVYLPLASIWNVSVSQGSAVVGIGDHSTIDLKAPDAAAVAAALGRVQRSYYLVRPVLFATTSSPTIPIVNAQPAIGLAGLEWHSAKPGTESATIVLDRASDNAVSLGTSADAVTLGVSSLLAERYAVGSPSMLAHNGVRVTGNDVLTLFDWAPKENVGTAVVRGASDVSSLKAPDDAKARIVASVADGSVAYVPTNVVKLEDTNDYYGWWNVGADGTVRDEMQNGRHTEMEEEAVEEESILVRTSKFFRRHGGIIRCVVAAVAISGMSAEGGAETAAEWAHAEYEIEKDKEEIAAIAEGAEDDQNMAEVCSE